MHPSFSVLAARVLLFSGVMAVPLVLTAPAVAQAVADQPTADQIVEMVHLSRALKEHELLGTLSKGRQEVPFAVRMQADWIRFYFDKPKQVISLNLKQKGAELTEAVGGSNRPVPAKRYAEGIRGTDLTYDDISFRFLYWPKKIKQPNLETVKTRRCWVVDLYNDKKVGEYSLVRIFVDRESGGLMQMWGYDWENQKIKELKVTSGMKVDGATVLKSMDVLRYVPGTNKVAGETVFELRKPR